MKPTTEQILSALNEMLQSKTELKSEKIELGLVDDIDKLMDKASSSEKAIEKALSTAQQKAVDSIEEYGKVFKVAQEGLKAAKELGVDAAIKLFNTRKADAEVNIKTLNSIRTKIDGLSNQL
jgi:hypothetical protein